MLRGLFIGIDKYPAPITRLTCARADALALGSLFEDNSDNGSITKLVDADATRENILHAIEDLKTARDDDFVVITFSGHGTDDHRLVPIDADASDLAGTCVSLDELAVHLDAILSRQMFVVLDCCFSGGIGGARVFAPTASRSPIEDRQSVERLIRGNGRLVLTASAASEPAVETKQFGHGLLSYHLIHAVQGYGDYLDSEFIPLLALVDYVTLSVFDSARLLGEIQTPTVYGSVEGAPALPRLTPGAAYAAVFPERVRRPATRDWSSLQPYGFSEPVLERWSSQMAALNELQLAAINDGGVLDGKSLLVVAPTSSGKTMIGELAAVREAEQGARVVMLLPMRALVNDKFDYFRQLYGDHLSVVRATGEHADQVGMIYSGQFDLTLLTYEKFLSIVTGSPWVLRGVTLVVIDEAQNIAEQSRGSSLEFLLALLRSGHARGGAPQVVALSAVIGDTNGLERWLGAELLRSEYRPIPLRESVIDGSGHAQHLNADGTSATESFVVPEWGVGGEGSKHIIIPLVRRLVGEQKKVIVFRAIKGETVGTARYLAHSLVLPPANSVLSLLPDGDLSTASHALQRRPRRGRWVPQFRPQPRRARRIGNAVPRSIVGPESDCRDDYARDGHQHTGGGRRHRRAHPSGAEFKPILGGRVQKHGGACRQSRLRRRGPVLHRRNGRSDAAAGVARLHSGSARVHPIAFPQRKHRPANPNSSKPGHAGRIRSAHGIAGVTRQQLRDLATGRPRRARLGPRRTQQRSGITQPRRASRHRTRRPRLGYRTRTVRR